MGLVLLVALCLGAWGKTFDPTEYFTAEDVVTVNDMGFGVFSGENDWFGKSIAGVGDVNGDGYDDLVVTSSGLNSSHSGYAYLIFGSSSGYPSITDPLYFDSVFEGSHGVTITHGDSVGMNFGSRSAPIGDVNGDGLPDFVISGELLNQVFVFWGRTTGGRPWVNMDLNEAQSVEDVVTITGAASAVRFGRDCAGIGDFNDDSFDDFSCTDTFHDDLNGQLFVFFGHNGTWESSFEANTTNAMVMTVGGTNHALGGSVAGAGDVNNDGVADLITSEGNGQGLIYVILGSPEHAVGPFDLTEFVSGDAGFKTSNLYGLTGNLPTVAGAGDMNGDGYEDILFAADSAEGLSFDDLFGRVHVVWGGPSSEYQDIDLVNWNSSLGFRINGTADHKVTGAYVASLGDIDGDGNPDIAFAGQRNSSGDYWYSCTIVYGMEDTADYVDSTYDDLELNGYRILVLENAFHAVNAGKMGDITDNTIAMSNFMDGALYVAHSFEEVTDAPTNSPSVAPSDAPSRTPTTATPTTSPSVTPSHAPSTALSTGPPTDSPVATDAPTTAVEDINASGVTSSKQVSTGVIVGSSVGGVVAAIGACSLFLLLRKRRNTNQEETSPPIV